MDAQKRFVTFHMTLSSGNFRLCDYYYFHISAHLRNFSKQPRKKKYVQLTFLMKMRKVICLLYWHVGSWTFAHLTRE